MTTVVTSFLLQRNGGATHSINQYIEQFKRLRNNLDCNIILFLDNFFPEELFKHNKTTIIPIKIEETETCSYFDQIKNPIISVSDNPKKNTKDFHIIMNSKTEFMTKALNLVNDDKLAWVDFGIGHVIGQDSSFKKIEQINFTEDGIIIPGCWKHPTSIIDHPAWRFSGGFFIGDRESLKEMHSLSRKALQDISPQITWEVNVWSIMESVHHFPFKWYYGNHDDSIFNFPTK